LFATTNSLFFFFCEISLPKYPEYKQWSIHRPPSGLNQLIAHFPMPLIHKANYLPLVVISLGYWYKPTNLHRYRDLINLPDLTFFLQKTRDCSLVGWIYFF